MDSLVVLKTSDGFIVMKHVNKRGNGERGLWGASVLPLQLSYKSRTLQKLNIYFKYHWSFSILCETRSIFCGKWINPLHMQEVLTYPLILQGPYWVGLFQCGQFNMVLTLIPFLYFIMFIDHRSFVHRCSNSVARLYSTLLSWVYIMGLILSMFQHILDLSTELPYTANIMDD